MVNPTLHVNKVFVEQVDKCLIENFHQSTMTDIINVLKKTCLIALAMFYENITNNAIKVYRMLRCVLYFVI